MGRVVAARSIVLKCGIAGRGVEPAVRVAYERIQARGCIAVPGVIVEKRKCSRRCVTNASGV
jgi:hypothetical protein